MLRLLMQLVTQAQLISYTQDLINTPIDCDLPIPPQPASGTERELVKDLILCERRLHDPKNKRSDCLERFYSMVDRNKDIEKLLTEYCISTAPRLGFGMQLKRFCSWNRGSFLSNKNLVTVHELACPKILITDLEIHHPSVIHPAMQSAIDSNQPLLIIAKDCVGEALRHLEVNKDRVRVELLKLDMPVRKTYRKTILDTLAKSVNSRVFYDASSLKSFKCHNLKHCFSALIHPDWVQLNP